MRYEQHELSKLWGAMDREAFQDLLSSVDQIGFTDPVIPMYEGKILDGGSRYEVGRILGRVGELDFRAYDGDPVAYVIAKNGSRRHLNRIQVAACIIACREWAETGRPKKAAPGAAFSEELHKPYGIDGARHGWADRLSRGCE